MPLLPLTSVLQYVESQGVRLYPLAFRCKDQPCIKNMLALASNDAVQIRAWDAEFPNCNWAMKCGPESNRLGIDIDCSGTNGHACNGMVWVEQMTQLHGSGWLDTVRVRTASGGLHLHYLWPAGIQKITSRSSPFADGVDVAATHGKLCIPPSIVFLKDGTLAEYVWEHSNELTTPAAIPDWLLELILATPRPASQPAAACYQNGDGKVLEGKRHETLVSFAGYLRSQGLEEAEMLGLTTAENQQRYLPPLSEAEVSKIVAGIAKYPAGRKITIGGKSVVQAPSSASPTAQVPTQPSLIKTLDEYRNLTPEKVDWVIRGLLARGALTHVDGKVKVGKTSLLLGLVVAILTGQEFMGLPTSQASVLYATEQNHSSFRAALERAGLTAGSNLHILSWQDTLRMTWEEILTMVAAYCAERTNIQVLIVDTLGQFAGLPAMGENDSGAVLAAMRPLQALLSQGLAICNAMHSRKSLGELGDSARGSSQLGGSADILLGLRRLPGNQKTLRKLECISRFDESFEELVIELENGVYVARGTSCAAVLEDAENWLQENLPATAEEARTMEQLLAAASTGSEITRSTLQRVLAGPHVIRIGGGKRNDPFRYHRARRIKLAGEFIA